MNITAQKPSFTNFLEKPSVQNPTIVDNHRKIFASKSALAFKGLPIVATHPVEKKIALALQFLHNDGIILVGENLEKAAQALKGSLDNLPKLVKQLFFIEEKGLPDFAVTRSKLGIKQFINLADESAEIIKKDKANPFIAKKGNVHNINEADQICIGSNAKFGLNDVSTIPSAEFENIVKFFDFTDIDKEAIGKLNKKNIGFLTGAKEASEGVKKITFADVGGQKNVIDELKKGIIYPIKHPDAFKNFSVNRGFILTGGPGTGKTLIAQALANEVEASFIKINGSELESKWVGETEKNWRELFANARKKQPAVIFIDEADAVFRTRVGSDTSRHDDKAVNTVLALMSDLEKSNDQVYVIATTNKIGLLDDAITRSGRFGKHIEVNNPDLEGCKHILNIHSKNKPIAENFDSEKFAKRLFKQNVNGADIARIVTDANAHAYDRLGIFEKMEKGTFVPDDAKNLRIEQVDFDKALKPFEEKLNKKNPIGFFGNKNKQVS
ncbi:MAG: ATP-binding protein [bacterium]